MNTALDHAPKGSLVVIFPESVTRAISLIEARNPQSDLNLPPHVAPQQAASTPLGNAPTNGNGTHSVEAEEYVQSGG